MRTRALWILMAVALAACTRPPVAGIVGHSASAGSPEPTNPPVVEPLPVPAVGPLGPIFPMRRPSPVPSGR